MSTLKMYRKVVCVAVTALALQIIGAARVTCPNDPNCICGGTLAIELSCNIDGRTVKINLLPNIYINIKCENVTSLDYGKLPKCARKMSSFKSVSFKDCPLPSSSFKDVLANMGIAKTMALIFQNAKNLSGYFNRSHFAGLEDLTKLLLSINGVTHLPDNLFTDINRLTWLNIRSNTINLSEELFKPLERLETLEISHNRMTNISSNLFSHLSFLRKLSLWQSNVTWFSKDLFTGVDVLEELDLSSNGLNELPSSIFKPLRKLKKLTLFSNKFSTLPQNLFKNNEELETVVILNNDVELKELPKYLFGSLPNLKQIYIQRSGLENIPYDVFADSPLITNISLAYNDIKTLSESIFNDQINLLELDLSYNKLEELKPKLFSSLVRLEKLNLGHNLLVEISGQTFSSLLSLIYLDMEHNNLKKISSYLFSNNKQRMSITLAYNRLDFEDKELSNNSWVVKRTSPFVHTYNLKLLNLSHNEFKLTFEDWFMNGHENLDISHNHIHYFWIDKTFSRDYENLIKKPNKQIWASGNPFICECGNLLFLDYIHDELDVEIGDIKSLPCPVLSKHGCYIKFSMFVVITTSLILFYIFVMVVFGIFGKQISIILKKRFYNIFQGGKKYKYKDNDTQNLIIKYSDIDEEFVVNDILPVLKSYNTFEIYLRPTENVYNKKLFTTKFTGCLQGDYNCITLVIFSSNYLTSTYRHVDIKKIHSEMLKADNTIYIFVDIGPENSIYAFLEEQRDVRTTVLWKEANFWEQFIALLTEGHDMTKYIENSEPSKEYKMLNATPQLPSNISFSGLPDWPNLYEMNTLTHSQV